MLLSYRVVPWLAMLVLLPAGCQLRHPPPTVDLEPGAAWVVLDTVELGSMLPLSTYVWVQGHREDFETVLTTKGSSRFLGFGRTTHGHAVEFTAGQTLTFVAWAEGHELTFVEATLYPGENLVTVQLRKCAVADVRVPMEIWIDVLQRMLEVRGEGELPKTGS
jgi:hypothetical protein